MASDGHRPVKVVELFGVNPNCLLTAPSETLCPGLITKRNAIAVLDNHFNSLVFVRGRKSMDRSVI
jgi:hypothetical protein